MGIAVLGALALLALGLLAYIYYLYKKRRLEFVGARKTEEPQYPDMQSFHGPVGYQPNATSPTSVYPNTEYAYSGIQLMHPAQTPSQANATVGNASIGYYQPSHSVMTDGGSMISGAGSSSTNVSHIFRITTAASLNHDCSLAFSYDWSHPFTLNKKE